MIKYVAVTQKMLLAQVREWGKPKLTVVINGGQGSGKTQTANEVAEYWYKKGFRIMLSDGEGTEISVGNRGKDIIFISTFNDSEILVYPKKGG